MENKKTSGIYKIINLINNKIYVGSAVSIKNRWKQHEHLLKKNKHYNTHLQFAYNKYGVENFKYEIIELVEINDLLEKETFWITKLKSNNNKIGYNRRVIANSNLGIKASIKTKKKLRKSHLGKKQSAETIKKISQSQYIKINQFNKDGIFINKFNSLKEAAKSLNKNYTTTITACAKGNIPSAFGFIWGFNEKVLLKSNITKLKVFNKNNNEITFFSSIKNASEKLNISKTTFYTKNENEKFRWERIK